RVWTETDNYWKVYYSLLENVKIKFDEENISIPYPQMSIHVNKTQENTIN
ncbi:mechanosensitive ion channel family protein, partial [Clostridium butyricum]